MPVRFFVAAMVALLSTGALWGVSASSADIASDNSSIQEDFDPVDEFTSYAAEVNEASEPCQCSCEPQPSNECCTCKKQKALAKKVASAYKPVFYDNDFSYLCDPCYDDWHLGESLKRMCVGRHGALDIGGQLRLRYHHELGMNKGGVRRFLDTTDDFLLNRLRLYANYEVSDRLRFYVEGIYADSYFESLPPRLIDVNNGDFLNLFVDYGITSALTIRAGRQELLYGAQRLVSPLDWSNIRRTFEGIKLMWRPSDEWSVDGFYTQFVLPLPYKLDRADYNLNFYGIYATYKGLCYSTLDLYNLGFDNQKNPLPAIPNTRAFSFQTTGARLKGQRNNWLWELEGAYQWGDAPGIGTGRKSAGFATIGLGRKLNHCWDPTVWFYFDYASRGYDQLFPLAHKYLGFIDAVVRSNVESPNVLITAKPHEKVTLLLWYYYFLSASPANVISIGGTPLQNPAVRDFGHEIDFLVKYQFKPHSDIIVGYSHFFRGSRIVNPGIPGLNLSDADFVYAQWTLNF